MTSTIRFFVYLFVALMAAPVPAQAQAYCALRDPLSALELHFSERTSHRSVVREVRKEHQQTLGSTSALSLRNAELGQHTLYVAFAHAETLGYIHTRSEKGRFGLIEIAWIIRPDMTIDSFQYQRCREPSRGVVELSDLEELISGKSALELGSLLDSTGALTPGLLPSLIGYDRTLAQVTVQSAIKTLIITELVWEDVI
jgi:hypothetical protein